MVKQQLKKNGTVAIEVKNGPASVSNGDSIKESKSDIQAAYRNYTEAQKHLQFAFKEQDHHGKNAYKSRAKQYQFYEEIIDKAFAYREMAEQQALEEYRYSLNKAEYIYREKIKQILTECKHTTDQAWNFAMETPRKNISWSFRINGVIPITKQRVINAIRWSIIKLQQIYREIVISLKDLKITFSNNTQKTVVKPETEEIQNSNG